MASARVGEVNERVSKGNRVSSSQARSTCHTCHHHLYKRLVMAHIIIINVSCHQGYHHHHDVISIMAEAHHQATITIINIMTPRHHQVISSKAPPSPSISPYPLLALALVSLLLLKASVSYLFACLDLPKI